MRVLNCKNVYEYKIICYERDASIAIIDYICVMLYF